MAEIQSLRELFRKEGLQFIEKLFSNYIIISEKLNATRFAFENDDEGKFTFHKKDSAISAIERTITQLFEEPINYIEQLPKSVKDKIPTGYKYGFRYFHSNTPINIQYDRIPENGLILTDIKELKTGKIVDDIDILNSMASLLNVQKPPVIWFGNLDDVQKSKLLEYLKTPEDQLKSKFKTISFTNYIISILNPSMKKTALNNDIEKPIDSIVFKFIGKDGKDIVYSKAVDPIIQQINRTNEEERAPQDMYGIILSDIVEFVKINGLQKYTLDKGSYDTKFVELICMIYNDYISKNGYKFNGVELDSLSFSSIPKLDLNIGFIPNIKTRETIKLSTIYKNIFKIMMAAFSKPKRKPTGTMTQLLIDDLREISTRIKEKVGMQPTVEESLLTFEEYLFQKRQKSYVIKD
jgi:hypothetical protein